MSVFNYHSDQFSTGQNLYEIGLTPADVNSSTFGKLFSTQVDGQVYAQPLIMSGLSIAGGDPVAYVATENDSLYAIDATSGQVVWQDSFINPANNVVAVPNTDVLNQGLIAPTIGITGTPVIDPNTNTLYLVVQTREQDAQGNYHYIDRLHALDVSTGAEKFGGPTLIADTTNVPQSYNFTYNFGPSVAGTGDGSLNGVVKFNAARQLQRPALTLVGNQLYIGWASYSDVGPNHGWILGYTVPTSNSGTQTVSSLPTTVFCTTPNGSDGTMWESGNQIDVDAQGNLYLSTGNGSFDTTLTAAGFPNEGDYGDSIIKLAPDSSTVNNPNINGYGLKVVDYFTPQQQQTLDDKDLDLGSGGVMLLPDSAGSAATPHLLIAAGKQGQIYLVNRDNMGKYNSTFDNVVQETPVNFINGSFDTPAYFNNTIYYVGSYGDYARAFSISGAQINLTPTSTSQDFFQYPGSTPTISANGTSNGIVWDLAVSNGVSQLRAYDASNYANELWTSGTAGSRDALVGSVVKYTLPVVANSMVYVGTSNAFVGYGLLFGPTNAPSNVTANVAPTVGTSGEIDLSWTNNSTSQTGLLIQRSQDGVNFTTVAQLSPGATTYQDLGLTPNTTYFYQVISTNQGVNSRPSNQVSAKTAPTPGGGAAPPTPANLTTQPLAGTGNYPYVRLSWQDTDPTGANNVPETGFIVERSTDGGNTYSILARLPATQTTYNDLNLSPNTYFYQVLSTNNSADSAPTAPASALIPTPPAHPSNASAVAVSTKEIDLSWQDNSNNEQGFQIYRRVGTAGLYTLIATLPPGTTSYVDPQPQPNTLYNYHIVAFNISGHNDFTGTNVTTPDVGGNYVRSDTTRQGSWQGIYGSDGYAVAGGTTSFPPYANVSITGASQYTWASSTTDPRALPVSSTPGSSSVAATWFSTTSFTVNVNLTDGQAHNVAMYFDDWDNEGRSEEIDLIDATTGIVVRSQTISNFANGLWLYWNVVGDVQFRFTNLVPGSNAVLSGLFFGLQSGANYIGLDSTTQGNWQGIYGADGYAIAGDSSSIPSYAQVSTLPFPYTWSATGTDNRALQRASGTGSVDAIWDTVGTMTINVNLTDDANHLVSLYLLDWENAGRSESIQVVDASTGHILNTQTVSNFAGGEYLTWNLRGNINFVITNLNPNSNAGVSGIFFGGAAPSATYINTDAATQGQWQGKYGVNGYNIVGDSANYPTYATVTTTGIPTYTWSPSTTDPRALERASTTGQVAATWVSPTSFTIGVNLLDGQHHSVALYLSDWDNEGRSERIDVVNATTGAVLNSQVVSNFSGGKYLVWNLTGNVLFRVTNLVPGSNAVVSGLFFGGAAPTASFVTADSSTQGSWKGTYGAEGATVVGDSSSSPSYAQVSTSGASTYTWASSTTDPRALQRANTTGQVAATWVAATTFTINVNLLDGQTHSVALYLSDWDREGRSERIDVLNATTGAVLNSQVVSNFGGGKYLVWDVSGNVKFRITSTNPNTNAVASGIFFGGATPTATYLRNDLTTQGNWKGVYGADGYDVIGDSASLPAYATLSTAGAGSYTWQASATDPRALQRASTSGQVAATLFAPTFSMNVNLLDGQSHEVSLYVDDYDYAGRTEQITVFNAQTGALLNTRTVSNFQGGEYLTWNLKGDVEFVFSQVGGNQAGPFAVVSGVFFGGATPAATYLGANTSTQGKWQGTYGADGYNVVGDSASYPGYAQVSTVGASTFTWASSTTDPRALQRASTSGQVAATWFGNSFTINVNMLDSQTHQVSLYLLDWEHAGRREQITVVNPATGQTLDSRVVSNFQNGEYLTYNISGSVQFQITNLVPGSNAVISGLFFGGTPAAASYLGTDTTTQGTWLGKYGSSGNYVVGATPNLPSYAQVTTAGTSMWTWSNSSTDVRNLQLPTGNGRIAATLKGNTFTVDLNLTDNKTHQVALYLLDWDNLGRSEQINVVNPVTGQLLDSRQVSNFQSGKYLVWNVSGHVQFQITFTGGYNAVLSGLFLD